MYCQVHWMHTPDFPRAPNLTRSAYLMARGLDGNVTLHYVGGRGKTKWLVTIFNKGRMERRNQVRVPLHSVRIPMAERLHYWCHPVYHLSCLCPLVFYLHFWFEWKRILNQGFLVGLQVSSRLHCLRVVLDRTRIIHKINLWVLQGSNPKGQ